MKKLTTEQVTKMAMEFVEDFNAKNQIVADVVSLDTTNRGYAEGTQMFTTNNMRPTGNLMGMIKKVNIEYEIFVPKEKSTTLSARIHWRYEHTNGGTNGSSLDVVILTESKFHTSIYESYITASQYRKVCYIEMERREEEEEA